MARLNTDGSLDATFGNDGVGTLLPSVLVDQVLVQTNHNIIAIGADGTLAR